MSAVCLYLYGLIHLPIKNTLVVFKDFHPKFYQFWLYMELVDREAIGKQKELMVGTVRGVLRAKVEQTKVRAVPQINFPLNWDPF